jgi:hypothetical protein
MRTNCSLDTSYDTRRSCGTRESDERTSTATMCCELLTVIFTCRGGFSFFRFAGERVHECVPWLPVASATISAKL